MIFLYARTSPCNFYFLPCLVFGHLRGFCLLELAWLTRAIGIGYQGK